jgi:hypothetical protein
MMGEDKNRSWQLSNWCRTPRFTSENLSDHGNLEVILFLDRVAG